MPSVAIIDYEMGNLHSIAKAVEHVAPQTRVRVTSARAEILAADRVIFPGVGGIGHCMEALTRSGLDQVVREAAASRPLLGICLGMQALLDASEESGGTPCLGLVPGEVRRFAEPLADPATGGYPYLHYVDWGLYHWARDNNVSPPYQHSEFLGPDLLPQVDASLNACHEELFGEAYG
jgi:glutamine amidotransferase